jgi:hypothetical protein
MVTVIRTTRMRWQRIVTPHELRLGRIKCRNTKIPVFSTITRILGLISLNAKLTCALVFAPDWNWNEGRGAGRPDSLRSFSTLSPAVLATLAWSLDGWDVSDQRGGPCSVLFTAAFSCWGSEVYYGTHEDGSRHLIARIVRSLFLASSSVVPLSFLMACIRASPGAGKECVWNMRNRHSGTPAWTVLRRVAPGWDDRAN